LSSSQNLGRAGVEVTVHFSLTSTQSIFFSSVFFFFCCVVSLEKQEQPMPILP
jgi:hypothetical protein